MPTANGPRSDQGAATGAIAPESNWRLVLGSALALSLSVGPVVQYSFAMFVKPVAESLGMDRGTVSLAPSLALLMVAASTPVVGVLADRFGSRPVVLPAILLAAVGLLALGAAPTPLAFIALYGLVGVIATGYAPLPFVKAISASFGARRGLALGLSLAGVGVGTACVPLLAQYLITAYGWRVAYLGLGLLVVGVAFPAAFLTLPSGRRAPEPAPSLARSSPTTSSWLRSDVFWKLAAAFMLVAIASSGVMAHVVAMMSDRGVPHAEAAGAVSMSGLAIIVGRLLSGYLLDRVFAPYVAVGFFLAPLAGLTLLLLSASPAIAWIATIAIGLGLGAEVDLIAFLVGRYFGQRSLGTIYGWLFTAFMLGNASGPLVMGTIYARLGTYQPAIVLFVAGLAIACLLMTRLGAYRFTITDQPA